VKSPITTHELQGVKPADDFDALLNDHSADPFKKNAEIVAKRVDSLLGAIRTGELNLATNYVQLGNQLLNVRSNKYWVPLGFSNFGKYIESIKDQIQIGRTQLYLYISTVEKLLPSVSESQLNDMGISKAVELQRVVSQTGAPPTQELIDFALDPSHTRESVKAEVYKHLNIQTPTETGIYFELGCYVTQEEREEIQRGLDVAVRIDPVIPNDWPENNRNKEILLRFVREFLSEYESHMYQETQ